jgi:hypothetical protein
VREGVGVVGTLVAAAMLTGSPALAQQTVGLFVNTGEASEGYTLFGPGPSKNVYLIDEGGLLVHQWATSHRPGMMGYLRPNGNLVRAGIARIGGVPGTGGVIEEFDWDGNLAGPREPTRRSRSWSLRSTKTASTASTPEHRSDPPHRSGPTRPIHRGSSTRRPFPAPSASPTEPR